MTEWAFTAEIWQHSGHTSWHFLTVPEEVSDEIADLTAGRSGGFGSVRVSVTVGDTTWATSVFPDRTAYVLPVKKAVRAAERLTAGEAATVRLTLPP